MTQAQSVASARKFKLYLYGIEIWRSFVETGTAWVQIVPLWNWNSGRTISPRRRHLVQIVPLWNWNYYEFAVERIPQSSICTFMELKLFVETDKLNETEFKLYLYGIEIYLFCSARVFCLSSNCTFMELKWEGIDKFTGECYVQIVPLWNWNFQPSLMKRWKL